jgi:hypothetical protein
VQRCRLFEILGLSLDHLPSFLKDRQRVRRGPNRALHVQRYTRQQERIPACLLTLLRQRLEVPQLTDIETEETEEVLMEY